MGFDARDLAGTGLSAELVGLLIDEHEREVLPRLGRLWDYYRNDLEACGDAEGQGRGYCVAQERGLPWRFRAEAQGRKENGGAEREVVIENDIGWRVHALVDFMFGRGVGIESCAPGRGRAREVKGFLDEVIAANGGAGFFADVALLGSVYGYVDVLVRVDGGGRGAGRVVLEVVEAPRAVPVLDPEDYRRLEGYLVHFRQVLNEVEAGGVMGWLRGAGGGRRASVEQTQLWTDGELLVFKGDRGGRSLVRREVNRLGRIPVVHIQNLPQPFFYEGLSEVEPLIPLQDELNTRLSDRANRVTFQSFKMYLGKGIEGFIERRIGPGQMWATDNPEASIQEFGGDVGSPSEEAHITEVRQAMDKASSVTPVAAGLIGGRVGNLRSENALRVTLMGLLARTRRKRVTYGAGIERLCELVLHAADVDGVFASGEGERKVRLEWPSPLPVDETRRLEEAHMKLAVGVPAERVLAELGYGDCVAEGEGEGGDFDVGGGG